MFYRLNHNYVIRGWDKMAWVLVHRPENSYTKLSLEEFQILLLCDGTTDLDDSGFVTDEMKICLEKYMDKKIVECYECENPLERDQYYRYYDNRFVLSAFWSITGKCNFYCRHCFMDAPEGVLGELSYEQAIELIDQMAECGILRIDITGGEPFVRQDFWKLIDRICYHNIAVGQVYTNGWLLTDTILDEFEKRNQKPEFSISFDGIGWHDWMRGVPGAEEKALQAIKLCNKRGFPVSASMCIHKGNQNTLRETVKLLSELGVYEIRIGNTSNTSLWERNSDGNTLNFQEYTETMIAYIPQFYCDGIKINAMLSGVISLYKDSKNYKIIPEKHCGTEECLDHVLCGAVRYACYITPEGRLLPCMPMTACEGQREFPLIQNIGLKAGLSNSFYMQIADSRIKDLLEVNEKCASCEHKYQCGGGCRAIALEKTGDLMGCDREMCFLWENGYVDRIRETADKAIAKYCSDTVEAL